jgi:hypothetical protein
LKNIPPFWNQQKLGHSANMILITMIIVTVTVIALFVGNSALLSGLQYDLPKHWR